jgi:hypothetical protein
MNRRGFVIGLLAAFLVSSAQAQNPPAGDAAAEHLASARKFGWQAVAPLIDNLAQSDPAKFPGLIAFSADYRRAVKGLDVNAAPAGWPAVDIDALVTRNPNFWRANYEVRPGDPAWLLVHAGLLLGAGRQRAHSRFSPSRSRAVGLRSRCAMRSVRCSGLPRV